MPYLFVSRLQEEEKSRKRRGKNHNRNYKPVSEANRAHVPFSTRLVPHSALCWDLSERVSTRWESGQWLELWWSRSVPHTSTRSPIFSREHARA